MSFNNTSAYPGNLKNKPNAVKECVGTLGITPEFFVGGLEPGVSSISSYISSLPTT